MPANLPYAIAKSTGYHRIRLSERQWIHIVESHDYMAGNMDKLLETLEEPDLVVVGDGDASMALRLYSETNITRKTMVVIYREEEDGFIITAFLTSRPDKVVKGRRKLWQKD